MSKKIKKPDVDSWNNPLEPWDSTTGTDWEDPLKDWDSSVEEFNVEDIKDYPLDLDKLDNTINLDQVDTPKEGRSKVKQKKPGVKHSN